MKDFEEIYKTYYPQVFKFVLGLCKDETCAEDITQETFYKAFKAAGSYRGECRFSVWLCQIAKNTYFSYLKKHGKDINAPMETLAEVESGGPSVEKIVEDSEMTRAILDILEEIQDPGKTVFYMRTYEDKSFAEIARHYHKTESWARVTFHRTKLKIQEELK